MQQSCSSSNSNNKKQTERMQNMTLIKIQRMFTPAGSKKILVDTLVYFLVSVIAKIDSIIRKWLHDRDC